MVFSFTTSENHLRFWILRNNSRPTHVSSCFFGFSIALNMLWLLQNCSWWSGIISKHFAFWAQLPQLKISRPTKRRIYPGHTASQFFPLTCRYCLGALENIWHFWNIYVFNPESSFTIHFNDLLEISIYIDICLIHLHGFVFTFSLNV